MGPKICKQTQKDHQIYFLEPNQTLPYLKAESWTLEELRSVRHRPWLETWTPIGISLLITINKLTFIYKLSDKTLCLT